ncbi:hypothetical protein PseAD21_16600 [Pseudomonas sp. AD21]|nr:hypothetical protein PseAD21_16600 [Pseudomonas sp. AD21]
MVKPRSLVVVAPVYRSVLPSSNRLDDVADEEPMPLAVPPLVMLPTERIPCDTMVAPV